jgi:hypothetical protein
MVWNRAQASDHRRQIPRVLSCQNENDLDLSGNLPSMDWYAQNDGPGLMEQREERGRGRCGNRSRDSFLIYRGLQANGLSIRQFQEATRRETQAQGHRSLPDREPASQRAIKGILQSRDPDQWNGSRRASRPFPHAGNHGIDHSKDRRQHRRQRYSRPTRGISMSDLRLLILGLRRVGSYRRPEIRLRNGMYTGSAGGC